MSWGPFPNVPGLATAVKLFNVLSQSKGPAGFYVSVDDVAQVVSVVTHDVNGNEAPNGWSLHISGEQVIFYSRIVGNYLVLKTADGAVQFGNASAFYSGAGVPAAGTGVNGDFYFRQDGAAGTAIYQKRAAAWVGIV